MSVHERAVSELHTRMRRERIETEKWQRLATGLAEALEAEVELRHNVRGDASFVRSQTSYMLTQARKQGLIA